MHGHIQYVVHTVLKDEKIPKTHLLFKTYNFDGRLKRGYTALVFTEKDLLVTGGSN